jgi:mRNA-degrading endonuclease RelE of RelBE toxin-antitoxin system
LIGAEIRKWQNDLPVDLKKLKTEKNLVRLAVGEWRIMFEARFENGKKVFYATEVIMRKDAYR